MKLYADILFKDENGNVISNVVQEETSQYQGCGIMTIHKFVFDWSVGVNESDIQTINKLEVENDN